MPVQSAGSGGEFSRLWKLKERRLRRRMWRMRWRLLCVAGRFPFLVRRLRCRGKMISAITGELREVEDDRVHSGVRGGGVRDLCPGMDIRGNAADGGEEITLHTIFDIEGDPTRGGLTPRLIGFLRIEDKRFFELFITVKGIGPKRALRALVEPVGNDCSGHRIAGHAVPGGICRRLANGRRSRSWPSWRGR